VVLPLKGGTGAKSRLGGSRRLAAAIALDCLDAVLACPDAAAVVVVTPDAGLAAAVSGTRARAVGESRPGTGLLAALDDGLAAAEGPVALLLGDLPALRPEDLSAALRAAGETLAAGDHRMAFVPDADGTGTVLLAGPGPDAVDPSFGPSSALAHARAGARRLDLALPRLRRDVDTPADLAAALALGVGPRTAAALRAEPGLLAALP
jgi:2-phospho-L-lactate guanylyltransferase